MDSSRPLYSPLSKHRKEIRLLHISPKCLNDSASDATFHVLIHCRFSVVSLEADPEYEALSYAWGDPTKERIITINKVPVNITRTLYNAICDLQLEDEERTIWADAVCINQENNDEKNHQVFQMKLIYERTSGVIVHLGQTWDGIEEAIEFWELLGNDSNIHIDPAVSPHAIVRGLDLHSERLLDSILGFFELDWWKRVWTVQEYLLAPKVTFQCGSRILSSDSLSPAVENLLTHSTGCCMRITTFFEKSVKYGCSTPESIERIYSLESVLKSKLNIRFLTILSMFRSRQSSNPRDKIYGMLGLSANSWADCVHPDYTLSTEEIYRDFVFKAVSMTGKLHILSHCYGKRDSGLLLPSFVPDWACSLEDHSGSQGRLTDRVNLTHLFNAARDGKASLRPITPAMAVSKGCIIDRIARIAPRQGNFTVAGDVETWHTIAEGVETKNTDLEMSAREEIFWQTVCGGKIRYQQEGHITFRRVVRAENKRKYEKWWTWLAAGKSTELLDSDVIAFNWSHDTASTGRHFVLTVEGRIGWVPKETAEGDVVAILAGGDVPYILRPTEGPADDTQSRSQTRYELIGDSYIHGIMDGEAVSEDNFTWGDIYLV